MANVATDDVNCECGEWSGEPCEWSGPVNETVEVEYMPEQNRGSHAAAGNCGSYPHNGARRVRVERGCAERMLDLDGEWVSCRALACTYSIFDGNPHASGPCSWPDHDGIEAKSAETAEEAARDAIESACLSASDGYEDGQRIYVLVWDASGEVVRDFSVQIEIG